MGIFGMRINDEKLKRIREEAAKENRSVSNFLQHRALNNVWDNRDKLQKIIEEIKKYDKRKR
ncbi:unnamed protein product [marine sediment metagenome]|uniref:Uncharacterized protein n=1 Tax=marine sediment metagenome TaxID=412755 RepID=X1DYM3_9ZZZZ